VNREDAEKALGIIRTVIQNTREDLVAHNWGTIWMIHSFLNLAACLCGWYVEVRAWPVFAYLAPLAVNGVLNFLIVLLLVRRDQGVRSYVEWQIHGIWMTFIIFTVAAAVLLHLSDAEPRLFGSLFAMTSGIGFAMMGVVFARQLPYAAAMLAVMLAGPLLPPGPQWGLLGLVWWASLFFTGLGMYRENLRRTRDANAARIL
jgi:hypothetical protein